MLGIVMYETDQAEPALPPWTPQPQPPSPNVFIYDSGSDGSPWPTPEQETAKQAQLAREQARRGNVTSLDGIHPNIISWLEYGPEEGQEMRLVPVGPAVHKNPADAARIWVHANVPEAGAVLDVQLAGHLTDGAAGRHSRCTWSPTS